VRYRRRGELRVFSAALKYGLDNRHVNAYLDYQAMPTYLLRDIPEQLWRRVKARAAMEGKSVRDALLALLDKYAGSDETLKGSKRK
jgi:hypothetical protein